MRKIKRELTFTTVQVLENTDSGVKEVATINIDGEANPVRIKKELTKLYPEQNVFYGKVEKAHKVLEMTAAQFIEHATEVTK